MSSTINSKKMSMKKAQTMAQWRANISQNFWIEKDLNQQMQLLLEKVNFYDNHVKEFLKELVKN